MCQAPALSWHAKVPGSISWQRVRRCRRRTGLAFLGIGIRPPTAASIIWLRWLSNSFTRAFPRLGVGRRGDRASPITPPSSAPAPVASVCPATVADGGADQDADRRAGHPGQVGLTARIAGSLSAGRGQSRQNDQNRSNEAFHLSVLLTFQVLLRTVRQEPASDRHSVPAPLPRIAGSPCWPYSSPVSGSASRW